MRQRNASCSQGEDTKAATPYRTYEMGSIHRYGVRWNISPFVKRGENQDQANKLTATYSAPHR